jgi:hypothetical protein
MEILEAYDLTGSFRQAAALVGCDHKTVAHWVAVREATVGVSRGRITCGRSWALTIRVFLLPTTSAKGADALIQATRTSASPLRPRRTSR